MREKLPTETLDNFIKIAEVKRTLAANCILCVFLRFLHDTHLRSIGVWIKREQNKMQLIIII